MNAIELFPCSGGMAEGFRRAGVHFEWAFDIERDHCDSYEKNLGHRPVCMDVRDLLRMVRSGWAPTSGLDLVVADPPCTPWSRAGKRKGVEDPRDMLGDTCELIRLLRPRAYLIGNVPGLDDSTQWHHVQRALAPLRKAGYCIADYVSLDAADFGVPQHRIRPFWFGHLAGPCINWPLPTHCAPTDNGVLPGTELKPWVTCRDALQHLPLEQLGRPVRLKWRVDADHRPSEPSEPSEPSKTLTRNTNSNGALLVNTRHSPASPAPTLGAKVRGQSAEVLDLRASSKHPPAQPAHAVKPNAGRAQGAVLELEPSKHEKAKRPPSTKGPQWSRRSPVDSPAPTVLTDADTDTKSCVKLEWPWNRPSTTIQRDERIPPPGHHDEYSTRSMPNAVVLSELAATILQGFPESWCFSGATKTVRWSQLGQAMPPPLAVAVARSVAAQFERTKSQSPGRGAA